MHDVLGQEIEVTDEVLVVTFLPQPWWYGEVTAVDEDADTVTVRVNQVSQFDADNGLWLEHTDAHAAEVTYPVSRVVLAVDNTNEG